VSDVFVVDLTANTIELASRAATATGAIGLALSGQARLSTDGRYVAFGSSASNLVPGDTNGLADVFLRDRQAQTIERISVATGGAQASGGIGGATNVGMSGNAQYFVFTSGQQSLAPGDTNNLADAFFRDRIANTTERLSNTAGTTGSCSDPAISADGSMLAFSSTFTDLVTGDTNAARDTFYRTRTGTTLQRLTAAAGVEANGITDVPNLDSTGSQMSVSTDATNLITGDTNTRTDIYVYRFADSSFKRASVDSTGVEANGGSTFAWMAGNGGSVVYTSTASNLIAADANGVADTFKTTLSTPNADLIFASGFE
jgi:hypothetical protein